jgi:hypothetical protein
MRKPVSRVTVTVPGDLIKLADARAKRERRSRSWVLAEALRRFLEEPRSAPAVRETANSSYQVSAGLGEQRLLQLQADMVLTPEQRVRESEEMFRTALLARPQPRFEQVLMFSTLEDYFAWKKRDVLL